MTHKKRTGNKGLQVLHHHGYPKIASLVRLGLLLSFFFVSDLRSQEARRSVRLGIGGGFGSNISRTYIEAYAGDIPCGVFEKGSAPGASFFGLAEIPLPFEHFSLMPQIGYHDLSSSFVTQPFAIEHAADIAHDSITQIFRTRNYSANIKTISLNLLFAWRPFPALHLAAGPGLAIVASHSYDQTEKLPSDYVYTENSRSVRTVSSGAIDTRLLAASLELGAGYDIPIRPNVSLSPEFRASIPITPITSASGSNYRTWSYGGVIALMYSLPAPAAPEYTPPLPVSPPPPPPPVAETKKEEPTPPRSILRVSVKAVGKTESGDEVPEPVIAIENVRITDVAPTLNYLFFDDGSSEIPTRYHSFSSERETQSFDPSTLYTLDALGIHHELLNILGRRMQEKPESKITITGTRSLHSAGDSAAASDISLIRAEHTAKYLQDVWGIAPSRIRVRSRALPEQASDDNAPAGQAENRRIEITTNTPSLLEPIETHRIERTATPPNIVFKSNIVSSFAGLKSQIITIKQGGKIIKTIDGLASNPGGELLWDIAEGNAIANKDSITWQMDVVDSADATASVVGNINIRKEVRNSSRHLADTAADKSLERFHLLLFDYSSSAELGSISDEIFDRIASSITPDSRVSLIGHTDITGDPNYNEHLSYDRASRASLLLSSRLHKLGHSAPAFNLEARGAKDVLFDNSNAEGRFLSRTVRITIERDLNK
ncbi:MAG: OmpA family protein [Bacteroidota bacterium]|nr:OmpA family protein [Bacteroidota bacterium]MDP4229064.1 OmpA family protein [Bacteroidota bacterium]MDP4235414.1 OmpA family protein [Bacteroidota bacterium]